MNKIVSLLLVAMLMACSVASAEGIDIASMTDADLIALFDSVQSEMQNRNISQSSAKTLIEGKYIVGSDIQPGEYIITCTESIGDELQDAYNGLGDMYNSIPDTEGYGDIFSSFGSIMSNVGMTVEVLGDYGDVIKTTNLKTGEGIELSLKDGTALSVSDGTCTIEPK